MSNIKNASALLSSIAVGINKNKGVRIFNLEVVFFENGDQVLKTDVATALDYLSNDIYWDEFNDWSNADHADVKTF